VRAAASSTASGSESRRTQSSAISSEGLDLRPLAEQRDGLRLGERRDGELDLALHAKELPARDDERQIGAGRKERRELGRRRDDLLEVVDQDEQLALPDVLDEPVPRAEGSRDRLGHEGGITQCGKPDPEDPWL
jgi:hypothetical protein